MTQIVVRLPAEDKKWLELESQKQDKTLSELVREAVELLQNTHSKKRQKRKPFSDLIALSDELRKKHKIKSGPTDMSTNYKKYLYGKDFR